MKLTRRHMILGAAAMFGFGITALPVLATQEDEDAAVTALLNKIRREHGLPPLVMHRHLRHVAQFQAEQYAKLKHSLAIGPRSRSRIHESSIHTMAAENIAHGPRNYKQALAAWMESSDHRRHIIDPNFSYYGLAHAMSERQPDYPYWTLILSI